MNKGSYTKPAKETEYEFIEKKSRFIGYIKPVDTEQEAIEFIDKIRGLHPQARHNTYAYAVTNNGVQNQRYSDDGEPQGTAGQPILDVIKKRGLSNAVIVVTRYFGGILLGAAGLVRAYSKAASGAADEAGEAVLILCRKMILNMDYPLWGKIQKAFESFNVKTVSIEFQSTVEVGLYIPLEEQEAFVRHINDVCSGQILMEEQDPEFVEM